MAVTRGSDRLSERVPGVSDRRWEMPRDRAANEVRGAITQQP